MKILSTCFDYKDNEGKRKRKWIGTDLPEKCAKKALNIKFKEIVADFADKWNNDQVVIQAIYM